MSPTIMHTRPAGALDGLTNDEHSALVERILKSAIFAKSSRLRHFLRYVCECRLNDRPEEAHEQTIGSVVFKRPAGYNTAEDNIVRVEARQLRSKLREYFATEGRTEGWVLEVPKGSYLPVFRERKPVTERPRAPQRISPARRLLLTTAIIFALLAISVGIWGANKVLLRDPKTASPSSPNPALTPPNFVRALFQASPYPIQVVPSDSALVLMEGLLHRHLTLGEYANSGYLQPPRTMSGNPKMRQFWDFLSSRQIVNVGDMEVAQWLRISLQGSKSKVTVKPPRNMAARDFMYGNFILLGSAYANPWMRLFSRRLNFEFKDEELGGPSEILNINPRPGERKMYASQEPQWKDGVSYARVALTDNLKNTGRVLLIAGISMQATEAAADFLLKPSSFKDIQKVLGIGRQREIPNFELLLETSSLDGTPQAAHIVAIRVQPHSL